MRREAIISTDGVYRYSLTRRWDDETAAEEMAWLCVIGLNPSTADTEKDDPTIRRCVDFARRWGYSGLEVVNLFAVRATDPSRLSRVEDPVGLENNDRLIAAVHRADRVLVAWGVTRPYPQCVQVTDMLRKVGIQLWALGQTASGEPRHPLYVRKSTKPEVFLGCNHMEKENP